MFAIGVELLTGRYVATAYNDRDRVEWPPHPARLFSALLATYAELHADGADGEQQLAALRWLETLPPPHIFASSIEHAGIRTSTSVFVPVNDASIIAAPDREKLDAALEFAGSAIDPKVRTKADKEVAKLQKKLEDDTAKAVAAPLKLGKGDTGAAERLFPERRTKQPRTFPCATPSEPRFAFAWEGVDVPSDYQEPLDQLLRNLVRVGHSSSFVSAQVMDAPTVAGLSTRLSKFVPDEDGGDVMIRWVSEGQVKALADAFAIHQETEPRVLPARFVRYSEGEGQPLSAPTSTIFDNDFLVFERVSGSRLPITSVVGLARQIRRVLMKFALDPVHELLSGHKPDGKPSEVAHLAIVPLPVVGNEYADGSIIGVALIFPRECSADGRDAVYKAISEFEKFRDRADGDNSRGLPIFLGGSSELKLERVKWGEAPQETLKSRWWTRPSFRWASATPIALDRNPGDLHHADPARRQAAFDEAANIVRDAVGRLFEGPDATPNVEIDVSRSCVVSGTVKPRNYPRFPIDPARPQRVLVHVRLTFDRPVRGPLILGSGRYQGLGLCLPIDGDNRSKSRGSQ